MVFEPLAFSLEFSIIPLTDSIFPGAASGSLGESGLSTLSVFYAVPLGTKESLVDSLWAMPSGKAGSYSTGDWRWE